MMIDEEYHENKIKEAENKLKYAHHKLCDLTLNVAKIRNSISTMNDEMLAMNNDLNDKKEQLQEYTSKCSNLDLELIKAEINLTDEKKDIERQNKAMEDRKNALSAILQKNPSKDKLETLKAEYSSSRFDNDAYKTDLKNSLTQRVHERLELEQIRDRLSSKCAMLKNRNAAKIIRLKKKIEELKAFRRG